MKRREFLAALSVLGATPVLSQIAGRPHRIDVHHHLLPPEYMAGIAARPEGSLKEIEYAFEVLKADGIALMTSFGERWLGDPAFWPVMQELDRRKAVVYTHPTQASCCRNLMPDVPASTIEYATDTTRTMASLLFTGAATRFPGIRWIFSHGGGTAPFLIGRFSTLEANMKERERRLPNGVMHEIRRFHYDTAQANHPGALDALISRSGARRRRSAASRPTASSRKICSPSSATMRSSF